MNPTKKLMFASLSILLLGTALMTTGCFSSRPQPVAWTLDITKASALPFRVDLIGIRQDEITAWEGYDIDKYWEPNDPRRRDKEKDKLTKSLAMGEHWVLDRKKDPKWKEWLSHGATHLLIIADLPDKYPPAADPRRKIVPLDKKAWDAKNHTLEIEIKDTIIEVHPKSSS